MILTCIKYEFNKISGIKYIWICIFAFFTVNALICLYKTQSEKSELPTQAVADFFELYQSSPETLNDEYDAIQSYAAEQNMLWAEQMQLGNYDYELEKSYNKYAPNGYTDEQLFLEVFTRINSIKSYKSDIQKVIDNANANLTEFYSMDVSPDTYTYKYQLKVISIYKNVQENVWMGLEYTRGWDDYFDYDIVNIFIFASLIIIGAVIFAQEKNTGFLPIIRILKNGKTQTAISKISAMIMITVVVVLLFTAETWLIYGLRIGYSSPYNAIQVFGKFKLCPYVITVGQYFLITVVVKLLTFMLFSGIVMLISVFLYNYTLIYICGLGFFGMNFLLYTLDYITANNPLKNLNIFAIAVVDPLFVRYRSIYLFSNAVDYVPFMFISSAVLLIIVSTITIWKYNRGADIIRIKRISTITSAVVAYAGEINRKQNKTTSIHRYSLSLFGAETYKTLISSRYIFIIVALFLIKGYISYGDYRPNKSYADSVYKDYMTTIAGEMTDEKRQYLTDERAMINDTLSQLGLMQQSYVNEAITFEVYKDYLSDYNYAYSRSEYLTVIEDHAAYIDKKAAEHTDAWFIYDTGWKTLFFTGFDWTMYVALLLLFTGIFADEYDGSNLPCGFAQILRTTKNGRRATFYCKLASAFTITIIITIIWNSFDFALIYRTYEMPLWEAPLQSIESFSDTGLTMTVGKYLIVFYLVRTVSALMLTALVFMLSGLLHKHIFVMAVTIAPTLFPALLVYFGMSACKYADFTSLLRATPMLLLGINTFAIYSICFAVIITIFLICTKRIWCK